ncbi:chemotaxis protein CheA [Corchorus olitorius]|uniref:Chemotaxis protein CheA n=1 Tax=Corchorus olitorius TaxID=93759 RepID=A0A1R3HIB0_9ROSI|nr:chemotaxis protein CheA [Corchorus olitorius]
MQQSVGSQRHFKNHVDSLLFRGRAVRRALDNEEMQGEVNSRSHGTAERGNDQVSVPREHGIGVNRMGHSQALLRTNGLGGSCWRSGSAARGAGVLGAAGQRCLWNVPARSGDPRCNYPGRYWKPVPNIGDEVSSASIGNLGVEVPIFEEREGLVEAEMRRKKGKAVLEVPESYGNKEKIGIEGMGESFGDPLQKLVGGGLPRKDGVSGQFIPGVGLAEFGPNEVKGDATLQGPKAGPGMVNPIPIHINEIPGLTEVVSKVDPFVFGTHSSSSSARPC